MIAGCGEPVGEAEVLARARQQLRVLLEEHPHSGGLHRPPPAR